MAQVPSNEQEDVFGRQLAGNNKGKQKSKIWRGIGLTVLGIGAVGLGYVAFTEKGRQDWNDGTQAIRVLTTIKRDPDLLFENVGQDVVNVLVVGEDYNWKPAKVFNPKTGKYQPFHVIDTDSPPRSDTMIVMSLNRAEGNLRMLSMPRDARVTYKDLDDDIHRARKFNSVYATGGREPERREKLLSKVIGDELGIRIDRFAIIKPNSFKKLVDLVGGVQVDVDGALKLDRKTGKLYRGHIYYKDSWGQWEVDLDPGVQWLNGEQAHGYVRFRKDREGDPGRIRRQQDVMKALAKRVMEKPIYELPGLAKGIRTQFYTDMTDEELGSLAYFAKNHGLAGKIQPMTLFGIYAGNGDIILNRDKNEKLLPVIFGNSFNPDHFLVRSPSTNRDDIGPANNANPSVQALLRKAGLLDEQTEKAEEHSVRTVEVRMDESAPRDSSSRRRRIAEAPDSSGESSSSDESPAPRHRRHTRVRHESDASTRSGRDSASSHEPTDSHSDAEPSPDSPVPQPEHSEQEHAPEHTEPEAPAESPVPKAE